MARLFFNIGPLTSTKNCLMANKICQSRSKNFAELQINPQKLPKTLKILPKWRNFAKSGHTD